MIYGYCRISTVEQNEALQVTALEAENCTRIFTDKASGAKVSRPALDEMLAILKPGDVVVVWKLDRLGRSTVHLFNLLEDLKNKGVSVRSIMEGIDTNGSLGRFLCTILAGVAELERENIRQRVNAGIEQAKRDGVPLGRKSKFKPKDKTLIRRLHGMGDSYTKLARQFSCSRSTIFNVIHNDKDLSFLEVRAS